MAKKIGYMILMWFMISFVYVILAASMPALTQMSGEAATTMTATSNMTNYPGTMAAVQAFPVYVWFIPGGVGIIATAVFLKSRATSAE